MTPPELLVELKTDILNCVSIFGDFTLHSGAKTDVLYDVGRLFLNENRPLFKRTIRGFASMILDLGYDENWGVDSSYLQGIPTLGYDLAAHCAMYYNEVLHFVDFAPSPPERTVVIDDVCSTGGSFAEDWYKDYTPICLIKRTDIVPARDLEHVRAFITV